MFLLFACILLQVKVSVAQLVGGDGPTFVIMDNPMSVAPDVGEPTAGGQMEAPTKRPTRRPTPFPTVFPSPAPSASPTITPTWSPSVTPTWSPSHSPTETPSSSPTPQPTYLTGGNNIIFVTKQSFRGDFGNGTLTGHDPGLPAVDHACFLAAQASSLTEINTQASTFKAFLGSSNIPLINRISDFGPPGLRQPLPQGRVVVTSKAALAFELIEPINIDENGDKIAGSNAVWTGLYEWCGNWQSGDNDGHGTIGNADSTTSTWYDNGFGTCNTEARIFCTNVAMFYNYTVSPTEAPSKRPTPSPTKSPIIGTPAPTPPTISPTSFPSNSPTEAPTPQPTFLSGGSNVIFVSSKLFQGDFGNGTLSGQQVGFPALDYECQALAAQSSDDGIKLGAGGFHALIRTVHLDILDRLDDFTSPGLRVPYPTGYVVAETKAQISTLIVPINVDENGQTISGECKVWTGGTFFNNLCDENWKSLSGEGQYGDCQATNGDWFSVAAQPCTSYARVYCTNAVANSSTAYTASPTYFPTRSPTKSPSRSPSRSPTYSPTKMPSKSPTRTPTHLPTWSPIQGTRSPTLAPTRAPSTPPTAAPSNEPTQSPSRSPSTPPSPSPSRSPTSAPTPKPDPDLLGDLESQAGSPLVGGLLGTLGAVILISVIVCAVCYTRRKKSSQRKVDSRRNSERRRSSVSGLRPSLHSSSYRAARGSKRHSRKVGQGSAGQLTAHDIGANEQYGSIALMSVPEGYEDEQYRPVPGTYNSSSGSATASITAGQQYGDHYGSIGTSSSRNQYGSGIITPGQFGTETTQQYAGNRGNGQQLWGSEGALGSSSNAGSSTRGTLQRVPSNPTLGTKNYEQVPQGRGTPQDGNYNFIPSVSDGPQEASGSYSNIPMPPANNN